MPRICRVQSRSDVFQLYETLSRNREKRTHTRQFFLEGVHPFERAIDASEAFVSIAYNEEKRLSGWAQDMIRRAGPEVLHPMPAALIAELSDRENPCELLGILRQRDDGPERVKRALLRSENPLAVLCDRPSSPGNLGTVVRSADAFGASCVVTCGHSADFYDPQCIRSSIGTLFHVPFCAFSSATEVFDFLAELPFQMQIVGTSARGTASLHEAPLAGPTLLVVGNETFGMSKLWRERCDLLLRIPIYGAASSLNLGCAAGICLYEIARQRDFDGHR